MNIENAEKFPDKKPGRPPVYPFVDLKPGQKLVIPRNENIKGLLLSVRGSLNYYKRINSLKWKTIVVIEDGNVVAYRLN